MPLKRLLPAVLALLSATAAGVELPELPPRPAVLPEIVVGQILSGDASYSYVWSRLRAVVRDVFQDEMDPDYRFFVLDCDGEPLYAPLCDATADNESLKAILNQKKREQGVSTSLPLLGQ